MADRGRFPIWSESRGLFPACGEFISLQHEEDLLEFWYLIAGIWSGVKFNYLKN